MAFDKWTLYCSREQSRELEPARFAMYLAGMPYAEEILSAEEATCVCRRSPSQSLPFLHHLNELYSGTFAITLLLAKESRLLVDEDPISLLRCSAIVELTLHCLRRDDAPEIAQALKAVEVHLASRRAHESLDIGDICACVLHDAILSKPDGLSDQQVKLTYPYVTKASLRVEGLHKLRSSMMTRCGRRKPPRMLLPFFSVCVSAIGA